MSKSSFPKRIKVGPHRYVIHEVDKEWTEDQDAHGKTNTNTHEIWVNTTYTESHILDTLVHELLHAIWNQYGLGEKEEEETVVHRLATGWVQAMSDNEHLVKYINRTLRKMK